MPIGHRSGPCAVWSHSAGRADIRRSPQSGSRGRIPCARTWLEDTVAKLPVSMRGIGRRDPGRANQAQEGRSDVNESTQWRLCSTCRKPIPFGTRYYKCSVSTCNRARLALFFCSVGCWDAHVPTLRHRDAWAEEDTAPTREEAEREQQPEPPESAVAPAPSAPDLDVKRTTQPVRRVVGSASSEPVAEREVLVVMSKLKQHIRTRSGMNTSDAVGAVLSDYLRVLCEAAVDHARLEGRKTVMDRDFSAVIAAASGSTSSDRG
jgi:histone H3/H4